MRMDLKAEVEVQEIEVERRKEVEGDPRWRSVSCPRLLDRGLPSARRATPPSAAPRSGAAARCVARRSVGDLRTRVFGPVERAPSAGSPTGSPLSPRLPTSFLPVHNKV